MMSAGCPTACWGTLTSGNSRRRGSDSPTRHPPSEKAEQTVSMVGMGGIVGDAERSEVNLHIRVVAQGPTPFCDRLTYTDPAGNPESGPHHWLRRIRKAASSWCKSTDHESPRAKARNTRYERTSLAQPKCAANQKFSPISMPNNTHCNSID